MLFGGSGLRSCENPSMTAFEDILLSGGRRSPRVCVPVRQPTDDRITAALSSLGPNPFPANINKRDAPQRPGPSPGRSEGEATLPNGEVFTDTPQSIYLTHPIKTLTKRDAPHGPSPSPERSEGESGPSRDGGSTSPQLLTHSLGSRGRHPMLLPSTHARSPLGGRDGVEGAGRKGKPASQAGFPYLPAQHDLVKTSHASSRQSAYNHLTLKIPLTGQQPTTLS